MRANIAHSPHKRSTRLKSDLALLAIAPELQNVDCPTLWLADENAAPLIQSIPAQSLLWIVTNRYDIFQQAQAQQLKVSFSDFNLDEFRDIDNIPQPQKIIYRVSKEKAQVHNRVSFQLIHKTESFFRKRLRQDKMQERTIRGQTLLG